jgi:hypothetical protein
VLKLSPQRRLEAINAGSSRVALTVGARRANGTSLTYAPDEDAFRLLGQPVTFEDASGKVTGLALTLFRSKDSILIDGRDVQRTVTTIKRGQPQK